jgi:hypothetical protein
MLVAFNGKSYKDFYEETNRDNTEWVKNGGVTLTGKGDRLKN